MGGLSAPESNTSFSLSSRQSFDIRFIAVLKPSTVHDSASLLMQWPTLSECKAGPNDCGSRNKGLYKWTELLVNGISSDGW